MKIQKKTMYNIVFYSWATLTIVCYIWGLVSLVKWIINLF